MNTDRLEGLVRAAGPLLRRADEVLAAGGAPPEHPVWAELRRVRLLPSDAVNAVAALRPRDLTETAPELRRQARACTTIAADLPPPHPWRGTAADAYAEHRSRAAGRLSGDPDSLDERLTAGADLADALAGWMSRTRARTAAVLADVLSSAEAVRLASAEPSVLPRADETRAAAAMAVRVLRTVADSYESAGDLLTGSRRPGG